MERIRSLSLSPRKDGRREETRALIADMWSWMERAMYDGEQGKGEYLALYERKVRLEIES